MMADATNINNSKNATPATDNSNDLDYLRSIDQTLKSLLENSKNISQSNAKNAQPKKGEFQKRKESSTSNKTKSKSENIPNDFKTAFLKGVTDSILGSGWQDSLKKGMKSLGDSLGIDLKNIQGEAGNYLGNAVTNAFKNSKLGKSVQNKAASFVKDKGQAFKDRFEKGRNDYYDRNNIKRPNVKNDAETSQSDEAKSSNPTEKVKDDIESNVFDTIKKSAETEKSGSSNLVDQLFNMFKPSSTSAATEGAEAGLDAGINGVVEGIAGAGEAGAGEAGAAIAGAEANVGATLAGAGEALQPLTAAAPEVAIALLAVTAAAAALEWAIGPAVEGLKELASSFLAAGNRDIETRKKMLENQKKRLNDDVEELVRIPFKILKDAANELYTAWDNQIQIINGTQGYTKSDLQNLMISYSERIKSEGLSREINVADLTENLGSVLKSGLSGQVAEEFAYLATKLGAAVPSQDFFDYASTYASLAANAIKNGKSQSEAIAYANSELEQFTSNVLYASRELSGGFSTGLKDAQSLFEQSVQIAQASKTGDAAQISGVLTAVASTVGAIAPDIASDIVSAVTKAATGGNSSEIVALRSLAGVNASNTEFLRQFASDPQKIFSDLFSNLAQMQNMSPDAYMEVAEGLSSTFGLSMDALARVDFKYLAEAVSDMKVNNNSLEENMKLLKSGETTTTASQDRFQQINEQLLNEGLAYVLDSEYGRMIQEHMWDEQLYNELQEATYAVNLQGSALEFLEGIRQTMDRIMMIINPFSWGKKIANMVDTADEAEANDADIQRVLEAGKVGNGNAKSLYNLITRGKDLNLTHDYAYLRTGKSFREQAQNDSKLNTAFMSPYTTGIDVINSINSSITNSALNGINKVARVLTSSKAQSQYNWSTVGKQDANNLFKSTTNGIGKITSDMILKNSMLKSSQSQSTEDLTSNRIKSAINELLSSDHISELVQKDSANAYNNWTDEVNKKLKSISSNTSLEDALDLVGTDISQVKTQFSNAETEEGGKQLQVKAEKEEKFWDTGTESWPKLVDGVATTNDHLSNIRSTVDSFLTEWKDYYINHTIYNKAFNSTSVAKIKSQESKGKDDVVLALAKALTDNSVDVLKDPVLQTNTLLAEILLIAQAIKNQNDKVSGTVSLADTLAGLSLGISK